MLETSVLLKYLSYIEQNTVASTSTSLCDALITQKIKQLGLMIKDYDMKGYSVVRVAKDTNLFLNNTVNSLPVACDFYWDTGRECANNGIEEVIQELDTKGYSVTTQVGYKKEEVVTYQTMNEEGVQTVIRNVELVISPVNYYLVGLL